MDSVFPTCLRFEVTEIMEKSINNRPRRVLGGFAAGTTKDFADERILLKGMDWRYLMSPAGKTNWDHDDQLVVGKPIYAGMRKSQGLFVESLLKEKEDFKGINFNHPKISEALDRAEYAWEYAQQYKKDRDGVSPLAYSVQGLKVNDKGLLVQTLVKHVALTDQPVNPWDCTVTDMAKSLKEANLASQAINYLKVNEMPLDEINFSDVKSFVTLFKSFGWDIPQIRQLKNAIKRNQWLLKMR